MKNLIFLFLFLILLAFANCEFSNQNTNNQSIELKKGEAINSNIKIKKQNYQLFANQENEKIITIEGNNLMLDFKNISLIGTDDFTKPDEFKGVAIHIKNSNSVTIKNLNISGFRIALQADNVQYLRIDSCHFSYNYRADSSANFDIDKVEIGAIVLNNSENITIKNATISNNENGIVLNNSIVSQVRSCKVQFNSKVAFSMKNQSGLSEIWYNQIDWNLAATNWDTSKYGNSAFFHQNSMTHNGYTSVTFKYYHSNDFTASEVDFEIPEEQYLQRVPKLNPKYPKGEAYKLPTKYGVYNFEYPAIFLRTSKDTEYTFAMFGPAVGNWKFVASENVASANLKTGTFPATFMIKKADSEKPFSLAFEFIGERFQDEFGVWNEKGKIYKFGW